MTIIDNPWGSGADKVISITTTINPTREVYH
jgi:hypothetical protein